MHASNWGAAIKLGDQKQGGQSMSRVRIPERVIQSLTIVLAILLAWQPLQSGMLAQEAAGPKLKILILEGDEVINNIRQRTAREPIVQVEDENHKPVAGALVLFALPDSGPGAVFPGGAKTLMVNTNQKGQAVARGLRPNQVAGKYQIKITASFKGASTTATLSQTNAAGAAAAAGGIGAGKILAIIAIAGAAAAAGAVAATHNGQSSTTLSKGTPSVGHP
jgi:hypothetical protein